MSGSGRGAGEDDPLDVRADGTIVLTVHVQPGAARPGVVGRHGDALKVKVAAPAQGGKANTALVRLVADALGARRDDVALVSGASHRRKRLHIVGVAPERLREWLAEFGAS